MDCHIDRWTYGGDLGIAVKNKVFGTGCLSLISAQL